MPTELHRNWQGEKENCLIPSPSFNIFMYAGNQDWLMVCCRFPAGIVWPVFLLVLISSVLVTAGCVQDSAGSEEITFLPTPEPAVSIQGLVARQVSSLDTLSGPQQSRLSGQRILCPGRGLPSMQRAARSI
jgi:hypothetical protein